MTHLNSATAGESAPSSAEHRPAAPEEQAAGNAPHPKFLWGGLALGAVGLLLIPLLGWQAVVAILLWLITAALGFVAILVIWGAADTTQAWSARCFRAGGGVLLLIAAYFSYGGFRRVPSPADITRQDASSERIAPVRQLSASAVATQQYWDALRVQISAFPQPTATNSPATLELGVAYCEQMQSGWSAASNKLSRLSVNNVDPEAVEVGSRYLELVNRVGGYFRRMQRILANRRDLAQHANSPQAIAESMLRGFAGDPFGKFHEIRAADQRLGDQFSEVQEDLELLASSHSELLALTQRTRATLSARHGIDIGPLE